MALQMQHGSCTVHLACLVVLQAQQAEAPTLLFTLGLDGNGRVVVAVIQFCASI